MVIMKDENWPGASGNRIQVSGLLVHYANDYTRHAFQCELNEFVKLTRITVAGIER